MSTIDTTKIKVGDEIVARIKIRNISPSGRFVGEKERAYGSWIHPADVIEHVPAPLEIKVGDKWKPREGYPITYEVVHIHNNKAVWTAISSCGDLISGIIGIDLIRDGIRKYGNINDENSNG